MLDGSAIAAILTGVLALIGALATAWMSSLNENRVQTRANRKALARYSVPLLIASWDLANWFYDILEESNYSPQRCKAYGEGWDSEFTSYLIGQYFAGVHIIREMTHFFAHMRDERADMLKKLLWKIQDEFISMNYEGRENLEMRWFEGDILAAQEHLTAVSDLDGDGNATEMRTIGWVEFRTKYAKAPASKDDTDVSPGLKDLFKWYEDDFQRIVYRRFKRLYSTKWAGEENPQDFAKMRESLTDAGRIALEKEEDDIRTEQSQDPNIGIIVPDHRIRRIQHLLSDLVELLDQVSTLKFQRPVRRCGMQTENHDVTSGNPLGLELGRRIPCDCHYVACNPDKGDFEHRQLAPVGKGRGALKRQVSVRMVEGNGLMRKTTDPKMESPGSLQTHRIV
jgi:hypothetical protein